MTPLPPSLWVDASFSPVAVACLARASGLTKPCTTNTFVGTSSHESIDLSFTLDNSWSMNHEQEILGTAVPDLVGRLVNPNASTSRVTRFSYESSRDSRMKCRSGHECQVRRRS